MADRSHTNDHDERELMLSLAHDLRHSLFALRTGIQLLAQVREDAVQFGELRDLLDKEVQACSEHLKELLKLTDP